VEGVKTQVYTIDQNAPVVTNLSPASGSYVKSSDVSYTLSKVIASGSVVFTSTSGTVVSQATYTMTAPDLTQGSHSVTGLNLTDGTVYSLTVSVTDDAGRSASATSTNVTYDSTAASITISSPTSGSRTNLAAITYTLSEDITAGEFVVFDGVNAVGTLPLSGNDLTAGTHTVVIANANTLLVSGMTYTYGIANVLDRAGNVSQAMVTNVTYDNQAVVISNTVPAAKDIITKAEVAYRLSEDAATGAITFTWTGGTADPTPTHTYTMTAADLGAGPHTVALPFTLIDGAFYTVSFSATDLIGNPATTVSNTLVFFDSQYGIGPLGNVDNTDGLNIVNDEDVAKVNSVMGTRPGDRSWNPVCDLDRNNVVDTRDLMILWSHFGESTIP